MEGLEKIKVNSTDCDCSKVTVKCPRDIMHRISVRCLLEAMNEARTQILARNLQLVNPGAQIQKAEIVKSQPAAWTKELPADRTAVITSPIQDEIGGVNMAHAGPREQKS